MDERGQSFRFFLSEEKIEVTATTAQQTAQIAVAAGQPSTRTSRRVLAMSAPAESSNRSMRSLMLGPSFLSETGNIITDSNLGKNGFVKYKNSPFSVGLCRDIINKIHMQVTIYSP